MKFIILLTIITVAVAASSLDDVKKDFEQFELHQARLKDTYYSAYKDRGLVTFANIVKQNTFPDDKIKSDKNALNALLADATIENNEELARIADRIVEANDIYNSITDDETLSRTIKFRALMMAVQNPDNVNYPTAEDLKKGVKAVNKAEPPISGAGDSAYNTLYAMTGLDFVPSYLRIQKKMGIISLYYKRPEVNLSEEIVAKIDQILADNKEAVFSFRENSLLDTPERVAYMLKALPVYLKTYENLFRVLISADIDCSFVRCRSTKNDPEMQTDKPNSALKTSGSVFAAICATVLFFTSIL